MLHLDYKTSQRSPLHVGLAAGVAGVVGRSISAPVDVVKVNTQVGVAECRQNTLLSFINILKLEGPRGFLKGMIIGSARMLPFSTVQFGAWDPVRGLLETNSVIPVRRFYKRYVPASATLAGALTTVTATVATYPLDVLKTRAIAQSLQPELRYYSSLPNMLQHIVGREGATALLRGFMPSIAGAGVYGGVMFGAKDLLDEWLWFETRYELKWWQALINCTVACGAGAGSAYPVDVVRKKMQAYSPVLPKYGRGDIVFNGGMVDCVYQTLNQQGYYGLLRGLVPNMMRVVPATVAMFVTFKILCA